MQTTIKHYPPPYPPQSIAAAFHTPSPSSSTPHPPEPIVESILSRDHTDIDGPLLPDPVAREDVIHLVEALPELADPLVDVVHQSQRHVPVYAAGPDVCGVHAGARHALVNLTQL